MGISGGWPRGREVGMGGTRGEEGGREVRGGSSNAALGLLATKIAFYRGSGFCKGRRGGNRVTDERGEMRGGGERMEV